MSRVKCFFSGATSRHPDNCIEIHVTGYESTYRWTATYNITVHGKRILHEPTYSDIFPTPELALINAKAKFPAVQFGLAS